MRQRLGRAVTGGSGSDQAGHPHGRLARRYGQLCLKLVVAFVLVALGTVAANAVAGALIIFPRVHHLITNQEERTTKGAALGAAAVYRPHGWATSLTPEIVIVDLSGEKVQLRNEDHQPVVSSPGYSGFSGPTLTKAVFVDHRRVGSVTVKFGTNAIAGPSQSFIVQRWDTRLIAGAVGIVFALAASLVLSPMIAAPLDQVLRAIRARSAGQRQARAGTVRGLRDLRNLAATFDQMADSLGRQDQVSRNLIAYVVHDLRTPIAVLQASTEAMLDGVTETTPASLESLHGEVMKLGQMVDDLQSLSAAEAAALQLKMSSCDLATLADETADSLASIFDAAGVRLIRQLSTVRIRCDDARMREVISNLLTNAAKFTPPGGQVTIETRPSGDCALLRVSDTGVGIPREELPHLTERFYRGHGSEQVSGSGIGLAIVDELVRAHEGTIDIASQLGQGTQITIEIPRPHRP
jgi:signal transduction histidine kinase